MSAWLVWIFGLLGASHYRPSAYALVSDPIMMMLFVAAWGATSAACIAIGVALIWRRWSYLTMSANAASLFGTMFILFGLDFLMSAVTIFLAIYRLKIFVLGLTASVTVTVAIVTISRILGATRHDKGS